MSRETVDHWLQQFIDTALARDLDAHMALISPEVMVFGVPGFDTLGFDDWYRQCEHEFPQGLIRTIAYGNVGIRTADARRVLFKARETTETSTGERIIQGVEMLLQRAADDDVWRLKQLRLLPEDEARHDGLL
jgi:hypothetical protein